MLTFLETSYYIGCQAVYYEKRENFIKNVAISYVRVLTNSYSMV